jgi:hypothetical protein
MLKSFSVLYAGHILEGEGIGFGGVPAAEMGPTGAARHIAAGIDFEDVLQKKAWICGTAEQIIAYLKDIEARYPGLEYLRLGFPFGETAAQFKGQLTRFAQEVMPAFREAGGGSDSHTPLVRAHDAK